MVTLFEQGYAISRIAEILNVSRKKVQRWIRRHKEEGNLNNRHGGGVSRVTSPETDAEIVSQVKENPHISARAIRRDLNLPCSTKVVERRLQESGYFCRTRPEKIFVNGRQRAERLAFAQDMNTEDDDIGDCVIFTDEKVFSSACHGRRRVWREKGIEARFDPRNVVPMKRSGRITGEATL